MQRISTKVHGYVDYATGALLLVAPRVLRLDDRRSANALRLAGGGALLYSLYTDYELGVRRRLPMRAHLALDAGSGLVLLTGPWRRGYAFRGPKEWLPAVLVGVGEIAAAALTEPAPRPQGAASASSAAPSPAEERSPAPPVPATDPVDSAEPGIDLPTTVPFVAGGAAALAQDAAAPLPAIPVGEPLGDLAGAGVTGDARADLDAPGGEGLAAAAGAGVSGPGTSGIELEAPVDTPELDAKAGDPLPGVVSEDPSELLAAGEVGPAATAEEDLERAGESGRAPMGDTVVSAPPPIDMPGPSVPAPEFPESETERAERADFFAMDSELLAERVEDPIEALVAEEEAAAAMEARGIGGPVDLDAGGDPAMEAVYQAGGGEAEGFEAAEADLIENATHGDGHGNPLLDAMTPEAESDRSTVEYGEPDQEDVTEVVSDPEEDAEPDPGAGPGIAADR